MKTPPFIRSILGSSLVAMLLIAGATPMQAQNATWNANTGDWATSTNWVDNILPGTTGTATFSNTNIPQMIYTSDGVPAGKTIGGLIFSNTGTTAIEGGNSTGGGGNNALTIGSGGITINSGAGAVRLGNTSTPRRLNVTVNGTQTWTNSSNNTLSTVGGSTSVVALGNNTLTIAGSGNTTIATTITGTGGGIIKTGAGTLSLTSGSSNAGTSTYSGSTVVSMGTLILSGTASINQTSGVSVASGATFTHNGSTAYSKALTLAEGAVINGSGAFTPTSMTITASLSDGFTTFALGSASLTKAGNIELTLSGITAATYTLFSGGTQSGTFAMMTIGGVELISGGSGNFSGTAGGNSYTFTNATNQLIVAIPEPATWALLAFSLTTVMVLRRRRRE